MNQNDYVLYSDAVNHFLSLQFTDRISHPDELVEKELVSLQSRIEIALKVRNLVNNGMSLFELCFRIVRHEDKGKDENEKVFSLLKKSTSLERQLFYKVKERLNIKLENQEISPEEVNRSVLLLGIAQIHQLSLAYSCYFDAMNQFLKLEASKGENISLMKDDITQNKNLKDLKNRIETAMNVRHYLRNRGCFISTFELCYRIVKDEDGKSPRGNKVLTLLNKSTSDDKQIFNIISNTMEFNFAEKSVRNEELKEVILLLGISQIRELSKMVNTKHKMEEKENIR